MSFRLLAIAAAVSAGSLCACGDVDSTVLFVTVRARPTVRDPATLSVEVSNAGARRTQEFPLARNATFPQTFTVTAPGRSGAVAVTATAFDPNHEELATTSSTGIVTPDQRTDLALLLEPADFPVNQMVAQDQSLTFDTALAGRQLGVMPGGDFLVVWENDGPQSRFDIVGRLFSPTTAPAINGTTVSTDDFLVNQTPSFTLSPVLAAGPSGALVAWLGYPTDVAQAYDVMASVLGPDAAHVSAFDSQLTFTEEAESSPTALALPSGGYVVAWEASGASAFEIRAVLLGPDGAARVNRITNDTSSFPVGAGLGGARQFLPHGAALLDGGFVLVWQEETDSGGENLLGRFFETDGTPRSGDLTLTSYSTEIAANPHVATTSEGFVAVWQRQTLVDSAIILRRVAIADGALSTEIEVAATADWRSAPAIGVGADGVIGVAWHGCGEQGDGHGCGIRARLLRPSGMPAGDDFVVNTTVEEDQLSPSLVPFGAASFLVAWTDSSHTATDMRGLEIRARVVYPSFPRHDGAIGAECGGPNDQPCAERLECASSVDGERLCHPTCSEGDGTPCPAGGVCSGGLCLFP